MLFEFDHKLGSFRCQKFGPKYGLQLKWTIGGSTSNCTCLAKICCQVMFNHVRLFFRRKIVSGWRNEYVIKIKAYTEVRVKGRNIETTDEVKGIPSNFPSHP